MSAAFLPLTVLNKFNSIDVADNKIRILFSGCVAARNKIIKKKKVIERELVKDAALTFNLLDGIDEHDLNHFAGENGILGPLVLLGLAAVRPDAQQLLALQHQVHAHELHLEVLHPEAAVARHEAQRPLQEVARRLHRLVVFELELGGHEPQVRLLEVHLLRRDV